MLSAEPQRPSMAFSLPGQSPCRFADRPLHQRGHRHGPAEKRLPLYEKGGLQSPALCSRRIRRQHHGRGTLHPDHRNAAELRGDLHQRRRLLQSDRSDHALPLRRRGGRLRFHGQRLPRHLHHSAASPLYPAEQKCRHCFRRRRLHGHHAGSHNPGCRPRDRPHRPDRRHRPDLRRTDHAANTVQHIVDASNSFYMITGIQQIVTYGRSIYDHYPYQNFNIIDECANKEKYYCNK